MCGRTACSLSPENLCKACAYRKKSTQSLQFPSFYGDFSTYIPSYNVAPGSYTPVLVASDHMVGAKSDCLDKKLFPEDDSLTSDRSLVQMKWGLIPSWYHGEIDKFPYKMVNCRSESILDKASFCQPLLAGKRCVVVADGFFEWQAKSTGRRQPYFFYFPENFDKLHLLTNPESMQRSEEMHMGTRLGLDKTIKQKAGHEGMQSSPLPELAATKDFECAADITPEHSHKVVYRPLTMAGIFDVWQDKSSEQDPLYSYSVITVSSAKNMSHIHDRMPAILPTEEAVENWLNYKDVGFAKALMLIHPYNELAFHPVDFAVGNSSFDSPKCVMQLQQSPTKRTHDIRQFFKPKGEPVPKTMKTESIEI